MKKFVYLSFIFISIFLFSCVNDEERTDKPDFVIGNGWDFEDCPMKFFSISEPEILNFADSNILKQNSINKVVVLKKNEEIRFFSSNVVRWDTSSIFDFDKNGIWKTEYEYEQHLYSESEYVGKKHNIADTTKRLYVSNDYWIGNKNYSKSAGIFFNDSMNHYQEYKVINDTGYIVYDSCYDNYHYYAIRYKYNSNDEVVELKRVSFYKKGANKASKFPSISFEEDKIIEDVQKLEKPIIVKNKEGKIVEYKDESFNYKYVYEKGLLTKVFDLDEDSKYQHVMEIKYNNLNLPTSFKIQQFDYSGGENDFIDDYNRGKLRGYGGDEYKIVWIK